MNNCGDCQICCEVLSIPEIDKDPGLRCKNQCKTGCSIYKDRPESCKQFRCLYLESNWLKELRPDKSGVMIVNYPSGYEAIRVKDKVNPKIMNEIKKLGVKVKGVDARRAS